MATRRIAVAGLDVKVESYSDNARDVEIAEFIENTVTDDMFSPLLLDLLDAIGKGFSVCEIIWDTTNSKWTPKEYKHRDPRFFQYPGKW